jgi:hypothetical protein
MVLQQAMLPRQLVLQQQQSAEQRVAAASRYTLLSCFRELPSVNTAPPPTAISIQQTQPPGIPRQLEQQQPQTQQVTQQQSQPQQDHQQQLQPQHELQQLPRPAEQSQAQQELELQQQPAQHPASEPPADRGPKLTPGCFIPKGSINSSNSRSSGSGTSLADIPAEVMSQLLPLLTSRDLAALASTCRGLRAATW